MLGYRSCHSITEEMKKVAEREQLPAEVIQQEVSDADATLRELRESDAARNKALELTQPRWATFRLRGNQA